VRGKQLLNTPEGTAVKFTGHGISAIEIMVNDPDQAYTGAFPLKLTINASMVAPKCAYPHHGNWNGIILRQTILRTTKRQGKLKSISDLPNFGQ
jgi:hypothetical protein